GREGEGGGEAGGVGEEGRSVTWGEGQTTGRDATSRKPVLGPADDGLFGDGLTTGGVLAQLLEERSQRVQFLAKAGPVAGFQLLHGLIVVAERLARSIGLGAGECGFG